MTTARKKTPAEIVYSFDAASNEAESPDPLPFSEGITLECPTGDQLVAINAAMQADDAIGTRKAIFGDNFEAANEMFGRARFTVWQKWVGDYIKHFFRDSITTDA